jgi:hypothetical protein
MEAKHGICPGTGKRQMAGAASGNAPDGLVVQDQNRGGTMG